MILYLWSFYSWSYFANYSLPCLFTGVSLPGWLQITRVFPEPRGRWHAPRGPVTLVSSLASQPNPRYKDLCVEVSGGHREALTKQQSIRQSISPQGMTSANFLWYSCLIIKTSFNWARSPDSTAQAASSNSSFYCGPCYLSRLSVTRQTRAESDLTQHASCLAPSSWWTLAILKSIWVRLTPQAHGWTDAKKMDPNKMLTGGLNEVFSQRRNHDSLFPNWVWMKWKNQRVKMSSFKNRFMASAYLMITICFAKMTGKFVMNVLNFNQFKVCKCVHFQRLLTRAFIHEMF